MSLPQITDLDLTQIDSKAPKYLLVAEGFEERSLSVAEVLGRDKKFDRIFVFQNSPKRKSRMDELRELLLQLTDGEIKIVEFARDDPARCEGEIESLAYDAKNAGAHVYIDISVFSRLLILMVVYAFRSFAGKLVVLYAEPEQYSPSEAEFRKWTGKGQAELGAFASAGLQDVLRTVNLSSSIMAGEPCVVVAFTSFNAHLIGGLLRSISPARFILIGSSPPRLRWRESAAQTIHSQVIEEYSRDNEMDAKGALVRHSSTLDYRETVVVLADIYQKFCFTHRIVIAPTGSKLQALGVAIFKSVCREIHIEYPMPAKYYADDYSSREIRKVHQIVFDVFSESVSGVEREFGLDGTWSGN